MSNIKWTEEAIALLRRLHADGLTKSKIAERFGCTRNAVNRKLDRLGLLNNKQPKRVKQESPRPRQVTAVPPRSAFNPGPPKGRRPDHMFGQPNKIQPWNPPPLTPEQKEEILGKGIPLTDTVMEIVGQGKQATIRWSGGLQIGQCKWVVNAQERGGEYLFCGKKVLSGCVYCAEHERRSRGSGTPSERRATEAA